MDREAEIDQKRQRQSQKAEKIERLSKQAEKIDLICVQIFQDVARRPL